ncbi:hypothetical protein SAMN05444159_4375 [Bradyrhizobium lablabi]|uniref:Resolvase/invertase-type recombinase catalytic domain-containing protein n=1 Tax=Bradyrhizobium lablabi TaxID=722472 RepID=A0A1M6VWH8_9BRAD|nr:hypothetical protein SAMN05444159_4375 [Bradyrhizobium lablabi]
MPRQPLGNSAEKCTAAFGYARLETDDNEKRFNERLGKIAKQKPKSPETKKPNQRK